MSEENNQSQGTDPQAVVMPQKIEMVTIRPMMGSEAEFKSFGGKSGNGKGLTASGEKEQR